MRGRGGWDRQGQAQAGSQPAIEMMVQMFQKMLQAEKEKSIEYDPLGRPVLVRERSVHQESKEKSIEYDPLLKRGEHTRAGREWSVSRIRRAYAAEIQGKTRARKPPRPRWRPNAALWLHQVVRVLR